MAKSRLALGIVLTVLVGCLVWMEPIHQHPMLISLLFALLVMIPFILRFEWRLLDSRELVLLALMTAIAAVSRVPFAGLPSVQPTTFVIIVTAVVFGAESGFVVGAGAALVSNLFLGQGPWTPWQMLAWGLVGLSAGVFRNTPLLQWNGMRLLFGFIWGFFFGWIMNVWVMAGMENWSLSSFIAVYAASLYFDLAHAMANVFFLAMFAPAWIRILRRFQQKYGLLDR
ncbi:ECF transporter S component [Melghirimyces algeriensis]|uniref:Energy-coupling factor transport system substrate-specific component n=1 Tax=Melghirimyces algeriensis TaxID=910412 RepID=A0A521FG43_9BACL|nr:ECF transporter S component [Melghirimyces algeriensis]SMO95163.1 energy-coupling factor transport system substrate-specific component [Melghirimyces algeriensis]